MAIITQLKLLWTHLIDPGLVPPVGGVVIAEVSELPVAGLVVQVAQGLLVPLHRDVRGPHHLVPPHCLNPHLILTSASACDHLGAEHQHSEIKIFVKKDIFLRCIL